RRAAQLVTGGRPDKEVPDSEFLLVRTRFLDGKLSQRNSIRGEPMKTHHSSLILLRGLCTVAVIGAACLLSVAPVSAHQNPPGCTGNNVNINIAKNKTQIASGDTVHYTVTVRNDDPGGCDVTGVQVNFFCP